MRAFFNAAVSLPPANAPFADSVWGNRLFWLVLTVYLAILPVAGTTAIRYLAFLALLGLLVQAIVRRQLRPHSELLGPWLLYGGTALASLGYAIDPLYSLSEIRVEIIYPFLLFLLAANTIRSLPALFRLLAVVALGASFFAAFTLTTQWLGGSTKDGLIGTLNTGVGNYSTYLVTVMPLIAALAVHHWRDDRRPLALALLVLLGLCGAAMMVTLNRQGFVALLVELAVVLAWLLWRGCSRRTLFILLGVAALAGWLLLSQFERRFAAAPGQGLLQIIQADPRWELWRFTFSHLLEHPLLGGGYGQRVFRMQYPDFAPGTMLWHAHNMVINKGVQMGVPGILAFLVVFFAVPWRLLRGIRQPGMLGLVCLAGVSMAAGVFMKNMTDDFFMRENGLLFWFLAGSLLGTLRHAGQREAGVPLKFLVVRRDNIGDLVCTTPVFSALRQRYPDARIDALVNSYNQPVLDHNPDIDHVYAYTKAKHREDGEWVGATYWRRLCLMLSLRREQYDYVILANTGYSRRPLQLAQWVAPRQIVGVAPAGGKSLGGIDMPVSEVFQGHEVQRVFSLLSPLGISGAPPATRLLPDPGLRQTAAALLQAQPWYRADRPLIGIHISARKVPQRWPVERFIELMHALHRDYDAAFMLFWSPGDEDNPLHPGDDRKAQAIIDACRDLPLLAYPTDTLQALIAGLSLPERVVCSDGGAMHVAAALGKPMVCFFGNSAAHMWYPWGVSHQLLQKESRDVNDISVAEALAAFQTLADEKG